MLPPDDAKRILKMRAERVRLELEEEIDKSNAGAQQKAFMRQKLAHLWQLTEHGGQT